MKPDNENETGEFMSPLEKMINEVPVKRNFNIITIVFTFPDFDPMIFSFRRQLSEEIKRAKDAFYGLSDEQQKNEITSFRINQLSELLLSQPLNVPEVSDAEPENYRQAFRDYFTKDKEMMGWLWGEYQRKLYPKEILSSPSE